MDGACLNKEGAAGEGHGLLGNDMAGHSGHGGIVRIGVERMLRLAVCL